MPPAPPPAFSADHPPRTHAHTLLAIDQGTTCTTALLTDLQRVTLATASREFPQLFPQPGWVEHDLREIWQSVLQVIAAVTHERPPGEAIAALGIANQRETLCFWNRKTGEPLRPAIVWQDRRTAPECEALRAQGLEPWFQAKTGLVLDPYFSGTKLAWGLKHCPAVQAALRAGQLAVGTIDCYLLFMLSGRQVYATEPSNASRTLCFDLTQKRFSKELCETLGIPLEILPEIRPSLGFFAHTQGVPGLADGIAITALLGDQQAALIGQGCVRPGNLKCTYGTGSFMLLNTGTELLKSQNRLLSTVAWSEGSLGGNGADTYYYALEGSAFVAGAAIQWLRDGLAIIDHAEEVETLALQVASSEGVSFVPAMTGLGAPYWNPHCTALFTGITRGTKRGHLARAVLEGIALQNCDLLTAMQADWGQEVREIFIDGGVSRNELLMQFQADVLGIPLIRPQLVEATCAGAIMAAGVGAGIWRKFADIPPIPTYSLPTTVATTENTQAPRVFPVRWSETQRKERQALWRKAVAQVLCGSH